MIPLPPDFKEFLQALNHSAVEYLLVGGYAVAYHGYPRTTADIDIWIRVARENALRTMEALRKFGFGASDASEQMFLIAGRVVRMGVPPLRIELLTSISGVEFDPCYTRRIHASIDGISVTVISREDLLANKRATGRAKDTADVEQLQ